MKIQIATEAQLMDFAKKGEIIYISYHSTQMIGKLKLVVCPSDAGTNYRVYLGDSLIKSTLHPHIALDTYYSECIKNGATLIY